MQMRLGRGLTLGVMSGSSTGLRRRESQACVVGMMIRHYGMQVKDEKFERDV